MKIFKISFFVLGVHAAAILWVMRAKEKINQPPVRLITQTVTFAEEVQSAAPIAEEVKKVVAKAPDPPIVEKPKPKSIPKKAVEKKLIKDPSLVAKAKENIAKISKTSDKTNSREPSTKDNGKPQAASGNFEAGYRDELANRLKLLLRLPEYGVVQVRLTVNRRGLVQKVEIVASESDVNKNYIEKALPELAFPPFGNNFPGNENHTFLISLNNEL